MTTHETQLASQLLDHLADRFADEKRNDWKFPDSWTVEQRVQFVRDFHDWNGSQEKFDPSCLRIYSHEVAGFLAHKMRTPSIVFIDTDRLSQEDIERFKHEAATVKWKPLP